MVQDLPENEERECICPRGRVLGLGQKVSQGSGSVLLFILLRTAEEMLGKPGDPEENQRLSGVQQTMLTMVMRARIAPLGNLYLSQLPFGLAGSGETTAPHRLPPLPQAPPHLGTSRPLDAASPATPRTPTMRSAIYN